MVQEPVNGGGGQRLRLIESNPEGWRFEVTITDRRS